MFGINLVSLIKTLGYVGVFATVFTETALLIGFFLPGDSLLFTAGFLASQGLLHILPLLLVTAIGAILGDSAAYYIGKKFGPKIFHRENSRFFKKEYVHKTEAYYRTHGGKTLVIARFIPGIRAFAPVMAGVGKMKYHTFIIYNILGGVLWTLSLTLGGFYLGKVVPNVDRYILPIVIGIILISLLPPFLEVMRARRNKHPIV